MNKAFLLVLFAFCPAWLFSQTPDTTVKRVQWQIEQVSREIDSIKIKAVDQSKAANALVDDLDKVQERLQKIRKEKASSVQTVEQKKQEEELVRQFKALSKQREDILHSFDQSLIRLDERVGYLNELKKSIGLKTDK